MASCAGLATPLSNRLSEPSGERMRTVYCGGCEVLKFLIWCILFVLCWPLALVALVLYPIVWLLLLPFRIVGIAVGSVLALVWALVVLPVRIVEKVV
jgi:hypothetical protein